MVLHVDGEGHDLRRLSRGHGVLEPGESGAICVDPVEAADDLTCHGVHEGVIVRQERGYPAVVHDVRRDQAFARGDVDQCRVARSGCDRGPERLARGDDRSISRLEQRFAHHDRLDQRLVNQPNPSTHVDERREVRTDNGDSVDGLL